MSASEASVLDDLDVVLRTGTSQKRVDMLRRVTDLFLNEADRFNEEQIQVFDDVLGHLIDKIEARALAEISTRLAPVDSAPPDVIQRLARHDAIDVAGPVLTHSTRLSDDDLVEIASNKSEDHLLAISGRANIATTVTDVLLHRGGAAVAHRVAANPGANFSETGFAALLKASETDEKLAERTGLRLDLPFHLLRELLVRATEAVRKRLLALAPADVQDQIRLALKAASDEIQQESSKPRDFEAAKALVELLKNNNELDEPALLKFARQRKYEETVVAISVMSTASIDVIKPLMQSPRDEGLLIPCKAADLGWETVGAVLDQKFPPGGKPKQDRDKLKSEFEKLTKANAQRLLRFWQVRQTSTAPPR